MRGLRSSPLGRLPGGQGKRNAEWNACLVATCKAPEGVETWDIDPEPIYAELLRRGPFVYLSRYGLLACGRHMETQAILNDWQTFVSSRCIGREDLKNADRYSRKKILVLEHDPPEHTRARQVLARSMSPKMLRAHQPHFDAAADRLVDAALDARVVIADVADEAGEALAARLRTMGLSARYHHLDVRDDEGRAALVDDIRVNEGLLHILVNNAEITYRAGSVATSPADWDRVVAVNLTGTYLGIRHCAPLIRDSGGGSIVNFGSVAGLSGYPSAAYCASKWGVIGLTKSASAELAEWAIRANAICPGNIDTPLSRGSSTTFDLVVGFTPQRRAADPDEVAGLVLFLVGADSAFITSEHIAIDGGLMSGGMFGYIGKQSGTI